ASCCVSHRGVAGTAFAASARTMPAIHHDARRRARAARTLQIVTTPGSGNGTALATARTLRDALRERGHHTRLTRFADLDELNRWAAEDRTPCARLVCVGGDGTLDTIALAAVRRGVPFLAVQSGFGNLF